MELYLSHNPYKITTEFRIDDKNCDAPWFTNLSCGNGEQQRLQMWIEQFFGALHAAYPRVKTFHLTYKGTTADCQDVEEEATHAAERFGIEIKVTTVPCGTPDDKFKKLRNLYNEAIAGPYEDFHQLKMKSDFKKIEDHLLSVSIMAPMKNGKSTLLNAILGQELLPTESQRCTAKISYIEHCERMKGKGFEAKAFDESDASSEGYIPCTNNVLKEWNSDSKVHHVRIRGAVPGIHVDDYRLQFVDTPGPDSAIHIDDRKTIDNFLRDNTLPMVCYIVDRINESERDYLAQLKEHMEKSGKQSQDRFIFIVSQMDRLSITSSNTKEANPIKNKIDKIKEDLRQLGISNPRIFPISALIALNARQYASLDTYDQEGVDDAIRLFKRGFDRIESTLLDYTSVSSAIKNKIAAEIKEIQKKIDGDENTRRDHLRLAELLSGIPTLEMAIEEYLTKYSVPARIYDAATVFEEGIQKANAIDVLMKQIAAKQISVDKISSKIHELGDFISQGKVAEQIMANFPEAWSESTQLKKESDAADKKLDDHIRKELAKLTTKHQLKKEEADALVENFAKDMKTQMDTMLCAYLRSIEEDAHERFDRLVEDYNANLKEILGEMPKELKTFWETVRFVQPDTKSMKLAINTCIKKYEHTNIQIRKIGIRIPDVMSKWVSSLKILKLFLEENVYVKTDVLKNTCKTIADESWQNEIAAAKKYGAKLYNDLRPHVINVFNETSTKLKRFEEEWTKKFKERETLNKNLDNEREVLEWVKKFQGKLDRILDLEA